MFIVMDGLYVKDPIMKAIKGINNEFGLVWKDKTLSELQGIIGDRLKDNEINTYHKTIVRNQTHRIEKTYIYSQQPLEYKGNTLYYIGVHEKYIELQSEKPPEEKSYRYLISICPNSGNIESLIEANRMRWKIENEGFNIQKNNGLELHHKMNRNNQNAIINYYHTLQIAEIFNQLIQLCQNTTVHAYGTIIKMWAYFCSELRILDNFKPEPINRKINLRY